MTLYIEASNDFEMMGYVRDDIKRLCPDPAITFAAVDAGYGRTGDVQVIYDNPTMSSVQCQRIYAMVHSPVPITIRPRGPGQNVRRKAITTGPVVEYEDVKARDQPGFTRFDEPTQSGVPPAAIDVLYDPSNYTNRGYWAYGVDGGIILQPSRVILAHEWGHVEEALAGQYVVGDDAAREVHALEVENQCRAELNLPERAGHEGGYDYRAKTSSVTGVKCFIASAAYGSELEKEVQELRSFRDDVLLRTRSGTAFFEEYFSHYYRLSPVIVQMMNEDPEVRELVRWSLVAPIVGFLRLAKDFPRESLADVPESWASYLEMARDEFASWTANLPVPTSFDGISAEQAAEELRVTLAHLTWDEGSADELVRSLEATGALPLRGNAAALEDVATTMSGHGADATLVARVTGIEATGARP